MNAPCRWPPLSAIETGSRQELGLGLTALPGLGLTALFGLGVTALLGLGVTALLAAGCPWLQAMTRTASSAIPCLTAVKRSFRRNSDAVHRAPLPLQLLVPRRWLAPL